MSQTTRGVEAFATSVSGQIWKNVREFTFRNVLVVDDDVSTRRIISTILTSAGYHVTEASDGRQAVESVRRNPPDFIVTDWDMPRLSGMELCEVLRRENRDQYMYILLLTARTSIRDMVRGVAAGADDYSSKPVIAGDLLSRLQAGIRVLEVERKLSKLASRDHLTQLPNRRSFQSTLQEGREVALAEKRPLACAMIDMDQFKNINDAHGHSVGDTSLVHMAKTLVSRSDEDIVVSRFGGDEFCALLPNRDAGDALRWAESCRGAVEQSPVVTGDLEIPVSISIGIAEMAPGTDNVDSLVDAADQALLEAKRQGRNRVVLGSNPDAANTLADI